MPISGWVLTMTLDESLHEDALRLLRCEPRATPGEPAGARLPFVLETSRPDEERALIDALTASPAVLAIDLVFLDFSDVDVYEGGLPGRSRRPEHGDVHALPEHGELDSLEVRS